VRQFFVLLVLLPGLLLATAGTIAQSFEYHPSDFVFDRASGYDVVALPGHYWTTEPGQPSLPLCVYNVLIPPDAEVTGIEVKAVETQTLPGEYNIHPAQRPQVLSRPDNPFVAPDPITYASEQSYPPEIVRFTRSGLLGGYRIAGVQLTPLRYRPALKQLELIARVTVSIAYETGRNEVLSLDESQVELMGNEARQLVINPEQVRTWKPASRLTDDWRCDMMVITNSALAASFQPFADWKTRRGYKTMIVRTESIYAGYPGRDNQEKIRNCISDYWNSHGLKWVLVGGDDQIVPVRLTHLTVEGLTEDIATDMYYADLQWSWDGDRNNYFGEMTDTVDLFYDLLVGRWPADNASDVSLFFDKCTTYERHPDTLYIKKVLFGSTMLFSPYHGKVINHIIADLFPTGWQFDHLEDPPSGAYASAMDEGYQLAHVAAHGNQTTFSVMDASECPGLTNGLRKLNFVNSIACESGWFDGYECLAEELVKAANGGCIATMLNSRYGFGYPPGFGPSEMLDLQFYRQFVNQEGYQFGHLCATSKDYFQSLSLNQEVWRWCVNELNLLGDPTLNLWLDKPHNLAVNHAASVPTGPQTFRVTVTDGVNPVKGALVCALKGVETYARGWTNSSGWIDLLIVPASTGSLRVSALAPNFYPYEGQVTVTGSSSNPALVFAGLRIDDSDGNGRLDPGESADLYVSLLNGGAADATGVTARLRSTCPYITFTDSTSSYGTIATGDTVEGDRFRVAVSPSALPGTLAEFTVPSTSPQGNWEPFFSTQIGPTPTPRKLWADHDIGNIILSVTSLGSIGTLGPYNEGSGLKYPRTASYGSLYFTSLAVGNGPTYVVDRWYGHPSTTYNTDWRAKDTLHSVIPPIAAQQEFQATIDDSAHPTPQGLTVTQWSGALSRPGYDDFVIITYNLENRGANSINGLYVGIMSDFDVNNTTDNDVYSDVSRRLTYMTQSGIDDPSVGIKLLSPASAANQSAIDHSRYVTPGGMMTEAVKDSFLRGAIHLANSPSSANYSCMVSAGPFNLAPSGRQKVAFAVVGGSSPTEIQVNADSAQSWYDHQMPAGLTYLRSIIDDAPPGGNGDGILNPGESINLPLWVCNRSDHAASGAWGILRKTSPDTLLTVSDSVRRFGAVGAGDSAFTGNDGFRLRVAAACTNGYTLPVVLACVDTLDSITISTPIIRVGAAQLTTGGVLCWDPRPGGNGNGRLDPNEQAEIAIGVSNIGLGNARNVVARLKSGDSRLTILDSLGVYGDVRHDTTVFNGDDRYTVLVGAVPPETQVPCTLRIFGDGCQATRPMMLSVGALTAMDPIPDGPRTPPMYYAYDDCDTFYVAHPRYEWVELRGRGTQLSLSDDETVTISLPTAFGPFRYYGQTYTQLSICSNGFVTPGSTTSAPWTNSGLPNSQSPIMIAANWDDLYPPVGGGVWYYHDAANHRFVIEWDSVCYYSPREQWDKFEIVVYDTSQHTNGGQNDIVVQYQTANNYVNCTAGLQDPSTTIGIQCLFNTTYHRAAAQIVPGRAIRYTTDSLVTNIAETPSLIRHLALSLRVLPSLVTDRAQIWFSLPEAGRARLTVHDITGRRVATLLDVDLKPGEYSLPWHRQDNQGRLVPAGIYVYRLETASGTVRLKTVVMD
jgi:hypothetical protein